VPATTGYQAGIETNQVQLSYGVETAWGTLPAVAFKEVRITSESLSVQKQRQRVGEIDIERQASDMVTTQITAGGAINTAFRYGMCDDLFASLFCNDWATDVLENGNLFKSLYFQKRYASNSWRRYRGLYVTSCSLNLAVGQFMAANFNCVAIGEEKSTSSASTGAITAAPGGTVFSAVTSLSDLEIDGSPVDGVVESIRLDITNEGAAGQFGIGSALAQGVLPGVLTVGGEVRIFFKNDTYYDRFVDETEGDIAFTLTDVAGNTYLFELLNFALMNPNATAGGPGQSLISAFSLEGRRDDTSGKTIRITRNPI
jgi:hypothetical protein